MKKIKLLRQKENNDIKIKGDRWETLYAINTIHYTYIIKH